ncbi:MAG: metallophosphatase family protein [Gammaproteobacteria bacterium]|nr:metallophosphatase family protein [Gammaproteobacteria bacterium]
MNLVTTVAIISDTHGELDSRIADIVRQSDIAIHAGDIGDASVLDAMQPKSGRIVAVVGNNDYPVLWPVDHHERLETIPEIAQIDLPGGTIAVEHGDRHDRIAPDHDSLRNAFSNIRLVVYGHTHKMVVDDSALPWVANPGASGYTRTHGGPSCLLLTASEFKWEIESIRFEDQI